MMVLGLMKERGMEYIFSAVAYLVGDQTFMFMYVTSSSWKVVYCNW